MGNAFALPRFGGGEESDQAAPPAFAEVLPLRQQRTAAACPLSRGLIPPPEAGTCRIRIADAEIAVPPGYPLAHLARDAAGGKASQPCATVYTASRDPAEAASPDRVQAQRKADRPEMIRRALVSILYLARVAPILRIAGIDADPGICRSAAIRVALAAIERACAIISGAGGYRRWQKPFTIFPHEQFLVGAPAIGWKFSSPSLKPRGTIRRTGLW